MYIGIDIGGTKCAIVFGEPGDKIIDKVKFPTGKKDETLEKILAAVRAFGKCDAVGISCGGPLSSEKGLIMSPPNLPDWDNVPIIELVKEASGAPTFLCNDANACALAEWKYGAGRGTRNMIFLTFGTGMGSGLIIDGRLYEGVCDMAGEIGHVAISKKGPVGYGKAGSFEGFCSGGGIAQLGRTIAEKRLGKGGKISFCESPDGLDGITAKTLADAASLGDPDARSVFRKSGRMLGRGLAILIDILNPELIVIGSIFARCEQYLRPEMEKALKKEALPVSLGACRITSAELGDDVGDIAALAIAENGFEKLKNTSN